MVVVSLKSIQASQRSRILDILKGNLSFILIYVDAQNENLEFCSGLVTRLYLQNGRTDLCDTSHMHLGVALAVLMWKAKFLLYIQVDFNYHFTAHYTAYSNARDVTPIVGILQSFQSPIV